MVTQVNRLNEGLVKYCLLIILIFLQLDESRSVDLPEIMFKSGAGCHQFYSEPTGRINSFNFDRTNPDLSRYQPGLRYKMCVNPLGITKCQVRSIFSTSFKFTKQAQYVL